MSATNQPNQSRLLLPSAALSTLNSLVDNYFECAICLDTAFEGPYVILECLHRFCDTCIKKSIQRCGAECPTCRNRITRRRYLRKDQLIEDIVSEKRCCCCLTILFTTVVLYLLIILLYSWTDTESDGQSSQHNQITAMR